MRSLLKLFLLLLVVAVFSTKMRAQTAPISNQQQLIFPIVSIGALGGGLHFQPGFHFHNLSNSTIEGELILLDKTGNDATPQLACSGDVLIPPPAPMTAASVPAPTGSDLSPAPQAARLKIEIPPGGSVRRTGVSGSSLIEGWAVFSWEGADAVDAAVELALVDGQPEPCGALRDIPAEQIITSVVIPATRSANQIEIPIVINRRRETAISISNLSGDTATELELTLLRDEGKVGDTNTLILDPFHRQSLLVWEWTVEGKDFGGITTPPFRPADLHGKLIVTSDQPIAVAAIDIVLDRLRFLTVPIRMPINPLLPPPL